MHLKQPSSFRTGGVWGGLAPTKKGGSGGSFSPRYKKIYINNKIQHTGSIKQFNLRFFGLWLDLTKRHQLARMYLLSLKCEFEKIGRYSEKTIGVQEYYQNTIVYYSARRVVFSGAYGLNYLMMK